MGVKVMANTSRLLGFRPANIKNASMNRYLIAADETTQEGDVLNMASTGTLTGTAGVSVGIQNGAINDETDGLNNATAVDGDIVKVWDNPYEVFIGQITTFTQTDAYTTRSSAACYDTAGSAGAQYIDAGASSNDTWKILRRAYEEKDGSRSVVGAYAKVYAQFNPLKHFRGPIA
jgi:hypothetical protein